MHHERARALLPLVCVLLAASSACSAGADERVVWRIGVVDGSSSEFRHDFEDYANPQAKLIHHLERDSDEHWWAFHPGPASALAGGTEHEYVLVFILPETPTGVYRLRVHALYQTPRLSHLRIDVNGHRGRFWLDPRLDHRSGDQLSLTLPHASAAEEVILIPAAWLAKGENRLVLTALDDPPEPERVWAWAPGHTGFFYDALELTHDASGSYDAKALEATVTSTVFYRPNGEAIVQVDLRFGSAPPAELRLRVAGHESVHSVFTDSEFGEHRFEVEVPAWEGVTDAQIEVVGGPDASSGVRRFESRLAAGRKWTLYVVPHVHLDVGFTHMPGTVEALQSEALDDALALTREHPDYRYLVDGFWVVERYEAGRSAARREALRGAIREGRVGLPPQVANLHTGAASLEGMIRSLLPGAEYARRHGLPLAPPHMVDVPSHPAAWASVLSAAGFDRFLVAANGWRAPLLSQGRWHQRSPFLWQGPGGEPVLTWYSRGYNQLQMLLGTPARATSAKSSLPVFLQTFEHESYRADAAIVFGTQPENARLDPEQVDLIEHWPSLYAWPRLRFATFGEAIDAIMLGWQGKPEVVHGDFGPYWEDGLAADARTTALHRRSQQRIASAEILSGLASALDPARRSDSERLRAAWRDLVLVDEHTWTSMLASADPDHEQTRGQALQKASRARNASLAIDESLRRSLAQLGASIGGHRRKLAVVNTRNAVRDGLVELDLPVGTALQDVAAKERVALQVLERRETRLPALGPSHMRVRFLAQQIPAIGYRLYEFVRDASGQPREEQAPRERSFESPHYRVVVDAASGGLKSIRDRALGVELLDPKSALRAGSVVYVTGGDDYPDNALFRNSSALAPPDLTLNPAREGRLVAVRNLPFGTEIELESRVPPLTRIRTRILLHETAKRIDFDIEIEKAAVRTREAVYVAFPFSSPSPGAAEAAPRFAYGSQVGWVDPAVDTLEGGSREWFAATTWAASRGRAHTTAVASLDAPLVTFGDVARGRWPTRFEPASGALFSWVMNNYWPMNFPAEQGGRFRFRYVLRSQEGFDPAALTRDAHDDLRPLEVAVFDARPQARTRIPGAAVSLLDVASPDLALVTWKSAEDGLAVVLRLVETAGRAGSTRISSGLLRFGRASRATALERERAPLVVTRDGAIELDYGPFEIVTVRVTGVERRERP